MRTTPRSETEAQQASKRTLLLPGKHHARIVEAVEKLSQRGNPTIEILLIVADSEGNQRQLRDWLTDSTLGATKLRHACEAVGALPKYEAGEISQADFPGHDVQITIGIQKTRGYSTGINVVVDYAAVGVRVVSSRVG